jgi:hypothetical protein
MKREDYAQTGAVPVVIDGVLLGSADVGVILP